MWSPSRPLRPLFAAGLALALAGCGFQPMYQGGYGGGESARGSTNIAELSQVRIAPIGERIGQQLHNELRNLLNPNGQPGDPVYRLTISLDQSERRSNLGSDAIGTRVVNQITANWRLLQSGTGQRVFAGQARSFTSYDVLDQPYATLAAERDATERGLRQIARRIQNQVAAYLARPRETAAAQQ